MNISIMQPGQEPDVIDVVREVFDRYVAPDFPQEGVDEFYKFANVESLAKRSSSNCFTMIGCQDGKTVGVIEIRDMSHISMFFVKSAYQQKGIGKALFLEALSIIKKDKDIHEVTVKSALNAVTVYECLGFQRQDKEQLVNGIRFIPMTFNL